jgi:hypothetical protein
MLRAWATALHRSASNRLPSHSVTDGHLTVPAASAEDGTVDAATAGAAPLSREEASWWEDRAALFRYRLAAAGYGVRIRLLRPFGEVVGIAGLVLGLVPFAAVVSEAWRAAGLVLICAMVVAAWPLIRWFGGIGGIMRAAASIDEGTRKIFIDMRAGMANPQAYTLLREIYSPLLEGVNAELGEQGWPCRLELANGASDESAFASVFLRTKGLADLSSLLGNLKSGVPDSRRAERRAESRQRLMRRWRALQSPGQPMNDEGGRNYCLAEVRLQGEKDRPQLVLDLGVAEYGQIARTCEALVNEFALFSFLNRSRGDSSRRPGETPRLLMRPSTALRCMPWRKGAHNDAGSPSDLFLRPCRRSAGLGVAVATIVDDGTELQVYVGERSGAVGTYPNVLHIIPAGNCNTHGSQRLLERAESMPLPDWYIRTTMRCEYLEEWFNDEDLETSRFPNWVARVDQRWVDKVSEITPITLTGIAFDLLNLRPEVCAVVEVAMNGNEVLNWEFEAGAPPEALPLRSVGSIRADTIVQGGAAVLLLARAAILESQQGDQAKQ